jgi:chromosome segregation ATPase
VALQERNATQESVIDDLRSQLARADLRVNRQQERILRMRSGDTERTTLESTVRTLRSVERELEDETQNLRKSLSDSVRDRSQLASANATLESDVAALRVEVETWRRRYENAVDDIAQLRAKVDATSGDCDEQTRVTINTQRDLHSAQQANVALAEECTVLRQSRARLERELEDERMESARLRIDLERAVNELDDIRGSAESMRRDLGASLSGEREAFDKARASWAHERAELEVALARAKVRGEQATVAETQLAEAQTRLVALESRFAASTESVRELSLRDVDTNERLRIVTAERDAANKLLSQTRTDYDAAARSAMVAERRAESVERDATVARASTEERHEAERRHFAEELGALQARLERVERERAELRGALSVAEQRAASAEERATSSDAAARRAEAASRELATRLDSAADSNRRIREYLGRLRVHYAETFD